MAVFQHDPWGHGTVKPPFFNGGLHWCGNLRFSFGVEAPVPFDFQVVCSNRISRGSPLTSFSHADVVYPPVTGIKHGNGQFSHLKMICLLTLPLHRQSPIAMSDHRKVRY